MFFYPKRKFALKTTLTKDPSYFEQQVVTKRKPTKLESTAECASLDGWTEAGAKSK